MPEYEVGVDEAGRGPAIGPLVVCALSVPKDDRELLSELGVDDSKRLSKKLRRSVFERVSHHSQLRGWGVGLEICDAKKIDEWMASGTLNSLEVKLFCDAIKVAANPSDLGSIIVDSCDVNSERFGKGILSTLGSGWEGCRIVSGHKMDSNDVVVGAASIIAKVTRDEEIEKLSKLAGLELGSGYPSDPVTKKAIDILCSSGGPHESLRWGWANVQRSWIRHNSRPMPSRSADSHTHTQSTLEDWN
tara:strand:- start:3589 stop:4326 length:738 start_codon:yes stop_codon:yes gene_type:complete